MDNRTSRARLLFWLGLLAIMAWLAWPMIEPLLLPRGGEVRTVTPRGDLAEDEKSTIALFENARDSVVFISTREQVMDLWTRNVFSVPHGTGSGFIWDNAGHVVTNYHVVKGASEASVKLADGRSFRAALIGFSADHDLAVLRIGVGFRRPPPVPLGTSVDLKVGQKVFAIGNPFGLDWTLTTGIISALDRALTTDDGRIIEHLIQTDAAINPGNSGGPLLDSAGRLIGINTAIYSPSGASAGIGFAVPVDAVNRVVPEIIRHGKYVRPTLGIQVDEGLNRQVLGEDAQGILILRVQPGSSAQRAGLRGTVVGRDGSFHIGDIITAIDDKPVETVARLRARLDAYRVGDTVELTVRRGEREFSVQVELQPGV